MGAALLIAQTPIMALDNWGWLLWGQLWPCAHPCLYYSVVVHEVPLFCVVKYSVVLKDNIKLLLHGDILLPIWVYIYILFFFFLEPFFPVFFVCWLQLQHKPLKKTQLEYCGFSYHSIPMNVLIILRGHTVDVITIHSGWAGGTTVGCRLWAGWLNTEVLFTACTEMSCRRTEYFWTESWLKVS